MCGICGSVGLRGARPEDAAPLAAALVHRGPDDLGLFAEGPVHLGFRRLSIVDLKGGHQPMGDNRTWVVFNGEIYNHLEIRKELQGRGVTFKTKSDTEVLLQAYRVWGADCLPKLTGMFAFAAWDGERLFAARDRLGIKPFYWAKTQDHFVFASELKAVLKHPGVPRTLSTKGLEMYATLDYVPAPWTIVESVRKLAPGHCLTVTPSTGEVLERRWWDLPLERDPREGSAAELAEELRALLERVVGEHTMADVPLGAFLSGGVDSTAVAALLAKRASGPVETFSIGFSEPGLDESAHAAAAARALGTKHHPLMLPTPDAAALRDALSRTDEPLADSTFVANLALARHARKRVTVALSGDGGDELFGGYGKYVSGLALRKPNPLKVAAAKFARAVSPVGRTRLRWQTLQPWDRYVEQTFRFYDADGERLSKSNVFEPEVLGERGAAKEHLLGLIDETAGLDPLSRMLYLDLQTYLAEDILMKVDKSAMAASLEVRPPLLDHRVVEFAWSLPSELKVGGDARPKEILRLALGGAAPAENLDRPKQGFDLPLARWMAGPWREPVNAWLDGLVKRGWARGTAVRSLREQFDRGRAELAQPLWVLASLEAWCESTFDPT